MHNEYKRIVNESDKAILFIHGIVGTPNHFKAFIPLVPHNISVYNVLLDGHGRGVKDFSNTSMSKWEAQINRIVDELSASHNEIFIVAHSLGCLLAIEQSIRNPKISKMFLLAVPLKLFLKPKMVSSSLKVYLNKISPDDKVTLAAKECYGIEGSKNPLKYLGWLPRFFELFRKIKDTRKLTGLITARCQVYQSAQDELVSRSSVKYLRNTKNVSVIELGKSGHYYYDAGDLELLKNEFAVFVS